MRILWLSHVIPYPPKAGVLLRSYYLLKAVAAQHTVDLFAFIQEPWLATLFDTRDQGLVESRRALESLCRRVEFAPIELLQRPFGKRRTALESLFSRDPYMVRWLISRRARDTLVSMEHEARYDLVHMDTISVASYRDIFPESALVLNHHNIESHMLLRRADNESSALKARYFRQEGRRLEHFERRLVHEVSLNVTCSPLDSERLRAIEPRARTVEIPNGVDVEFFQPQNTAVRADSLIFVGTMNWYPNVDAVLWLLREIFPRVRQQRASVTLDLVGANAPREVRDLAARTPGVKLHGFVPEVRPLMDSAALYVCPIRDGGGTKLKVLDAFAMAKCLVAHPVALEGIDAVDGREVVLAHDVEAFAAKTLHLLDNADERERIGNAARQLVVEKFSFATIGRELAEVYARLERAPR
jgi:glycosyltransferase involved in cell wall biosynthesis